MMVYLIIKDKFYLKVEFVKYESDYHEVSEIVSEHKTRYFWTKNKDLYFTDQETAKVI